MLARLMDFLKGRGITALFTSLTSGSDNPETTDVGVSSLMDTWLLLRNLEANGERNRGLYVLKSRGMAHSNQIREFTLSDQGAKLVDVYRGQAGVLTGTARTVQEARDHAEQVARVKKIDRKRRELERKRMSVEGQITSLLKEIEVESAELETTMAEARSAPSIFDDQRTVTSGLSSGASKRHTNVTRKGIANEPVYRVKRKNRHQLAEWFPRRYRLYTVGCQCTAGCGPLTGADGYCWDDPGQAGALKVNYAYNRRLKMTGI
jgi:hypothetical protein